ncbi:MAG TPA: hypothetical protein VHC41_05585 [Mycobacteriales bacterium]|nr:hypothetical protein [Mycobacteriales bacterium]
MTRPGIRPSRRAKVVSATLLGAVVIALAVLVSLLAVHNNRASALDHARKDALTQATKRVPEVLSYSYKTFDKDNARARQDTTGQFAKDFATLSDTVIAPGAKKAETVTKAQAIASSVLTASRTQVDVMLFIQQSTTSKTQTTTKIDKSTVRVTMAKANGAWLVSNLATIPETPLK